MNLQALHLFLMTVTEAGSVRAGATVSLGLTLALMAATGIGVWGWLRWRKHQHKLRIQRQAEQETRKKQTVQLRRRSRILEQILAVSTRLNTTRNPLELNLRIAEAVGDIGRFDAVILFLWSDSTQAFEPRGSLENGEEETPDTSEVQVKREAFEACCNVRFRLSNSYLIQRENGPSSPPIEGTWHRDPEGEGTAWQPGMSLIAPLMDSSGELLGYLDLSRPQDGLVPDIVDLRQLEFLFQQAAAALESADIHENLARNNAELQVASEKLNSLNDMKNNFVANVSHELRTPLTSISAYAEMLQQNMDSMNEEVRSEFLKVIHTESLKLTEVINDILELDNMGGDRARPESSTVDLVGLVRRMAESWRTRAQDLDIRISCESGLDSLVFPADTLLIQQMISHLLNNAFKFTPRGGKVTLTVAETGTAAKLVVEDSGIGIPDDKLGDIFDRFYQVDGSATREHSGQGVGLAICRDIVSHHDGRIWAENRDGGGARFTILLPCRAPVLQPVDPLAVSGSPFQPGEFMQRVMHWICESLGVQTATLMMPDAGFEYLTIRAAIGLPETVVQSARIRRGAGFAGKVWESGRTLLVDDVTDAAMAIRDHNEPRYSTSSLLTVPLLQGDQVIGVVSVNNRHDSRPLGENDRLLLEGMAIPLANLLARHAGWMDDSRYFATVRDTLRTITAVGHHRQESLLETCQEICLATAREINMPENDLEKLTFALHFYDVGLGFVPRQLLNKPGPLDTEEQRIVRKHVKQGLDVLEALGPSSRARQLILHHHENVDGSGYPVGLAGEAIPLGSRLLRLTDTLAALLSKRPWRSAHTLDEAMAEILKGEGTLYCQRMTSLFLQEAERRRDRIADQQARGMDHAVFKRPVLDPAHISPITV